MGLEPTAFCLEGRCGGPVGVHWGDVDRAVMRFASGDKAQLGA